MSNYLFFFPKSNDNLLPRPWECNSTYVEITIIIIIIIELLLLLLLLLLFMVII
jgi:hypothetical protein